MTTHLTTDAVAPDSDEPNSEQRAVRLAAPVARETRPEPAARAPSEGGVDGGQAPSDVEPGDD